MTLKFRLSGLLLCISSMIQSQPYGNEWINYQQSYFYFAVQREGVYRISQNDLINSSFPVSLVDPRNIQIFARGEEIPLHIEGEGDGIFDASDFIEFYALGNDGFADAELYGSGALQSHPGYSLFNDTIYYYITWNTSVSNKRYLPESDLNYGSYSPASFVRRKSVSSFNTLYYDGKTEAGGGTDPSYHFTEGWLDASINIGSTRIKSVPTTRVYTSGPPAEIRWKLLGESDFSALSPDHHLNVQFAGVTFDTIYEGYASIDKKFSVSPASLGATNTSFTFRSINDLGSGADRSTVSFVEVIYPHQLHFNNVTAFNFLLGDQSGQSKSYLPFTGFTSAGSVWIYDLTNEKRIQVTTTGSNHQVLIPNSGNEKKCIVFSDGNVFSAGKIKAVNGNGIFNDFSLLNPGNAFVIITQTSLLAAANQYASYRNSKGFNAVVADVEELYHQFIFGIRKHPLAVRRFADYISDVWDEVPSDLFLLGKSVKEKLYRKSLANFNLNLVPSIGNPASDNMLTAGLNGSNLQPLIPTGRLSAKTNQEINDYLQKVMEFESNTPQKWMKNILHFAGGTNISESNRFTSYLSQFEDVLTDTLFGGNVYTFKKNTTAPIQISISDSIKNLINNGTSMLTFFGHASTTGGFDQNIDDPQNWNNKGKYPLLVGNSCFTGDIHEPDGESVSETFVLVKDKGVIAFLASVDLGFEGFLRDYSLVFFKSLSQVNYGKSVGEHIIHAVNEVQKSGTNFPQRSVCLLMTLHGDPSLVINAFPLPDYEITLDQVSTSPDPVTTAIDSFELNLGIFNYGKATGDSVRIEIIRVFPDLSQELYTISLPSVNFSGNTVLKLPVDKVKGPGFNRFDISLDPSNLLPEMNESNNFVSYNLFIKTGDLIPVMPYEYAIVPDQGIELIASTGNSFEKTQMYEFQLDTNDNFTSPIESFTINSAGGVVGWKPIVLQNMKDSLVYFWRSRNTSGDLNSIWRMSSFQYIPGKRGWSQDHFDQFKSDEKLFLDMDENQRLFSFSPTVKKLSCQTTSTTDISNLGNILYKIDADLLEYGGCGLGPAIHIAVLDSLSFEPWGTPYNGENSNHFFGQLNFNGNCGKPRVQNFFIFQAGNAAQLAGLKDMLTNKIPDGHYILAWTWVRNDFSDWDLIDPSLRSVFTSLGADSIGFINNDSMPYIFFVQKGKPQSAIEVIGKNYDSFIYFSTDLKNNLNYGTITSTSIGPSSAWDSLHWNHYAVSNPQTDSLSLNMYGLAKDKSTIMADKKIKKDEKKIGISNVLSAASAPYMELDLFISDKVNQSAAQLDRWQVYYEGVMELALNSQEIFEFHSDTLQEGEKLKFSIAVKNISDYDADSVLVHYYIIDKNRKRIDIPYKRLPPIPAGTSIVTTVEAGTIGLKGNNTFVVEINPGFDQPEQHQFNNIGQIPFQVKGDNTNPVLDVTFDGVHILDGDIVSAKPEISVQLTDENPYLVLDDTSDFRLYLTDPLGIEKQYYFAGNGNYTLTFFPAENGKNKARVDFKPILSTDGIYALRVQAKDRSNNVSGDVDYRITFEVINRSTITNLINFPNPFSTSTRFVFVLTGSKIPESLQIQIMTVSGKIVKYIDRSDLGPIRIGRNITEYAWDGRDEFGDKLANGVYLYRVNTRLNGESIEHRSTTADQYFKEGFGKMVILR